MKPNPVFKQRVKANDLVFQEITRSSANTTIEMLVEREAVHPFTQSDKVDELKTKRLAPGHAEKVLWDKHCFGLFVRGKNTPEFAVFVKLLHIDPDENGNIPSEKLPGNIGEILASDVGEVENPNTAIFYTITSASLDSNGKPDPNHPTEVLRSFAGRTGGNELIVKVAEHLSQPPYNIKAFSTLSPVRSGKETRAKGFRQWLKHELSKESQTILTTEEVENVRAISELAENKSLYEGLEKIIAMRSNLSPENKSFIERLMTDLGTYYVAHERKNVPPKTAKKAGLARKLIKSIKSPDNHTSKIEAPLDNVTGFHIGNGAELAQVHWVLPEMSTDSDLNGAFGLMVNYRYYPEQLDQRKNNFRSEGVIRLSPQLAERYYARLESLGKEVPLLPEKAASGNTLLPHAPSENQLILLENNATPWSRRVDGDQSTQRF